MASKQDSEKGNYILYWRNRRKLSLTKLAAKMAISENGYASPNSINRWEKGEVLLPDWAIPELAKALKISEAELFYGPKDENPIIPGNVSSAYTGLDIEIADSVINMGYTSWIASRPEEARRAVQGVLPWLEASQRRAVQTADAKRLLARGYELLGVLAMDRLDNDSAIAEFRRALTISEEIGDTSLIVAHMTELGEAIRRKGDIPRALTLMGAALPKAMECDKATRGYVHEMLAYTYAEQGNEAEFRRNVEEAMNLLSHSGEGIGLIQRDFIPFEVLEIYGKALRDFGHPEEAMHYFNQAEEALMTQPNVPRWNAVLTISKAQAQIDAGEVEEGVKLAVRGITLAHACQSPRQMNRVRKVAIKLEKASSSKHVTIQPLLEVVKDIYMGGRNPIIWHPQHAL